MSFARTYTSFPGLATLAALPGTVVIQQTPLRPFLGGQFGTVAMVGEVVNDQASDSSLSCVNTLREITSEAQIDVTYGGFSAHVGETTDGFEGSIAAALNIPGIRFSRLFIIAPNMSAGVVTFTRGAGGDAYRIPAGTRVSDGGSNIFLTLEDVEFASSGGSQTADVRVRPENDSTSTVVATGVDTIVDSLDASVTAVNNAADCTVPDFDTVYDTAIDVLQGASGDAGDIDIVVCRRHTAAIRTSLLAATSARATAMRPLMAVYSPPVGTANATAVGSSGVGVDAASSRDKHLVYAYPGIQTVVPQSSASAKIDMHADLYVAQLLSTYPPEANIGEDRAVRWVLGLESGLDVQATMAQYETWLGLGIAPVQIVDAKAELLQDVTTDQTAPNDRINHVRMTDFIAYGLHVVGQRWAKKLRTSSNEQAFAAELDAYLGSLLSETNPDFQRIDGYQIDTASGNNSTTKANGLYVVKVFVTTLGHMDTIVFSLLAGKTVTVTAQSTLANAA